MISADLRIEGFDARSWTNLVSLFAPPVRKRAERAGASSDAPELDLPEAGEQDAEPGDDAHGTPGAPGPGAPDGMLFVVVSARGRVRKAQHTLRGRVKGVRYDGPRDLERLARETHARRAVALREGALEEIAAKIERRAGRDDDFITSLLSVARAFREALDEGAIHTWPALERTIPVPTPGMVRRALDLVLPDESAMTIVAFEGGQLWTAAALRRRRGSIDWIAGPDLLGKWAGELGGDWRRDHRAVADAVARNVAPLHLGIFAEARTLEELLRSRAPGAWARAVATREVIVQPTPPYVAVALGADAMRAVARRSAQVLGGLDALSLAAPFLRALRGRASEVASVTATLGFDPLKALAAWLERTDPTGAASHGAASGDDAEDGSEEGAEMGTAPPWAELEGGEGEADGAGDDDDDGHVRPVRRRTGAEEGEAGPPGAPGARPRRLFEIAEVGEDDDVDEHETAFGAEILPFPGVRRGSSDPPGAPPPRERSSAPPSEPPPGEDGEGEDDE